MYRINIGSDLFLRYIIYYNYHYLKYIIYCCILFTFYVFILFSESRFLF